MAAPQPNKGDVSAHLMALFPPTFVHPYPEQGSKSPTAFRRPAQTGAKCSAPLTLDGAADFAVARNLEGNNIYVGAALRQGMLHRSGEVRTRTSLAASHA